MWDENNIEIELRENIQDAVDWINLAFNWDH
jgi:hypothetical protein